MREGAAVPRGDGRTHGRTHGRTDPGDGGGEPGTAPPLLAFCLFFFFPFFKSPLEGKEEQRGPSSSRRPVGRVARPAAMGANWTSAI